MKLKAKLQNHFKQQVSMDRPKTTVHSQMGLKQLIQDNQQALKILKNR
ncbi:hypothetical protein [Paenibacillus polymyxa]|nr:hypothetical protein [Paenibacillus polymyxa]WPQ59915.1 hypothetical protein SKN87_27115 [Paenibacillus polymyxa]